MEPIRVAALAQIPHHLPRRALLKCVSNWNDCLESTRAAHAADCSELLDTIWARSGKVGSHTYSRMHAAPSIRRRNVSP